MLFNSYLFMLIYLPVVLVGYYALRSRSTTLSLGWLTLCSLLFYAWWKPIYLVLILVSIEANYLLGYLILRDQVRKKFWIFLGVCANLGLIGYYKYAHFLLGNVYWLTGYETEIDPILLPLAISFFTFQQIGFLVDCAKGETPFPNFLHYTLFVSFFPQLIAGPIVAHDDVIPQFLKLSNTKFPWRQFAMGIMLFSIGLFKKVMLADTFAVAVTPVFAAAEAGQQLGCLDAWGGVLAYTFQLYLDFSGYSDMALGLGHLFGIVLPVNFLSPYKATSIADFWRRWHITLSRFLREYLYFPLGGSRCSEPRILFNLMLTMLLCGLWHGAGWTFVIWGGLHGLFLILNRLWKNNVGWNMPRSLAWGLTFLCVMLSWVIFRAESLTAAGQIYQAMFALSTITQPTEWITLQQATLFTAMMPFLLLLPNAVQWTRGELPRWNWKPVPLFSLASALLLFVSVLHLNSISEFLYFNF